MIFADAPRLGDRVAEELFMRALCLPSSCGLTVEAQMRVIDIVRSAIAVTLLR